MNKRFQVYGLLLLVFISISTWLLKEYNLKRNTNEHIVEHFQKIFNHKESIANKALAEYDNADLLELKKEDITLLKFRNDSLISWTNNSISLNANTKHILDYYIYSKIGSGYYYIVKKGSEKTSYYALILIQKEYKYKNKYLKSGLQRNFKCIDNLSIREDIISDKYSITDSNSNRLFSLNTDNCQDKSQYLLYLLYLFQAIVLITLLLHSYNKSKKTITLALLYSLAIIVFRLIFTHFKLPQTIFNSEIFITNLFNTKALYSIGNFIIDSVCINIILYMLSFSSINSIKKRWHLPILFVNITIALAVIFFALFALYSTIYNTDNSLSLYKWTEVNILSYIIYLSCFSIIYSTVVFVKRSTKLLTFRFNIYQTTALITVYLILLGIIITRLSELSIYPGIIILLIIYYSAISYKLRKTEFNQPIFYFLLLTISTILTIFINSTTEFNHVKKQIDYTNNLFIEKDSVFEKDIIQINTQIKSIINDSTSDKQDVIFNICNNAFGKSYYINSTLCTNKDLIFNQTDSIEYNCFEFFEQYSSNDYTQIENTNFIADTIINGSIHYIGKFPFQNKKLYIELFSKPTEEGIGYPELLSNRVNNNSSHNYSYAKFLNNSIINSSGKYNFINNASAYNSGYTSTKNSLIYCSSRNNVKIVVHREKDSLLTQSLNIPYLVILFLFIHLFPTVYNSINRGKASFQSFTKRIKTWYIIMLLFFFLIIGIAYAIYDSQRYNYSQQERISNILNTLTRKLEKLNIEDYSTTKTLIDLSDILETDINIYNTSGILVNSSRFEIFENDICSNLIEPNALNYLKANTSPLYINKESINTLKYLSAYIPLLDNNNNKLRGYINIPYFIENTNRNEELINLIVFCTNMYILISLLAIILSILIADKITRPINVIYTRLKSDNLREKIQYKDNDEIGRLIQEYNGLLEKLKLSSQQLAKSERESAWRNMAKQIAHEIKNPLTPMKLNIQHLEMTKDYDSQKWDKQFHKTCTILLNEIDNLSQIASSFSDFANISTKEFKKVDIIKIINEIVNLFSKNDTPIQLHNGDTPTFVYISEKQLRSVITNIIKNALQAIKANLRGTIDIKIKTNDYYTIVQIVDNGEGVPIDLRKRLFEPHFTTKSAGMGLGLAICKEIIENAKGKIWFESEEKKGTSFFIKLPLYNE